MALGQQCINVCNESIKYNMHMHVNWYTLCQMLLIIKNTNSIDFFIFMFSKLDSRYHLLLRMYSVLDPAHCWIQFFFRKMKNIDMVLDVLCVWTAFVDDIRCLSFFFITKSSLLYDFLDKCCLLIMISEKHLFCRLFIHKILIN